MADYCDFAITAAGDETTLEEIASFIRSGIDDPPGGFVGLQLERLFPESIKDHEHGWIGMRRSRKGSTWGHACVRRVHKKDLYFRGYTKWTPPWDLFESLAQRWRDPVFTLVASCEQEDGKIVVSCQGGRYFVPQPFTTGNALPFEVSHDGCSVGGEPLTSEQALALTYRYRRDLLRLAVQKAQAGD